MPLLEIKNLHAALEDGTEIVKSVDLAIEPGEKHAIMGPNGSGKSTLASALAGHPAYKITQGEVLLDGENVVEMEADEHAQKGLFLAFQYPHAIPGVSVTSFLRSAINAKRKAANGGEENPVPIPEFRKELLGAMEDLKVPRELASRYLNDGFSGGEKKRVEILQMAMLKPRIAVLDETDSGLDIDALKIVARGVERAGRPGDGRAIQVAHRSLAYLVAALAVLAWRGSGPRLAAALPPVAIAGQMGIGVAMVLAGGESGAHAALAGLHVAGAGAVWASLVALAALAGSAARLPSPGPALGVPVRVTKGAR